MGGLIGGLLQFKLRGLEFVLTALFTVIFIDQWRKVKIISPPLLVYLVPLSADLFLVPLILLFLQ